MDHINQNLIIHCITCTSRDFIHCFIYCKMNIFLYLKKKLECKNFEVWDLKGYMYIFFQRMVQRIQPYILLLSLVTALWLLFYLRFVYKVNFMSLFIEQYVCTFAVIPPLNDHPGFEDVVVAYSSWSFTRYWATTSLFWKELGTHILLFGGEFKLTSGLVHPIYIQERWWSGHVSSVCLQMMNILISCIWTAGWRNKCIEDLHSWIQIE